VTSFKFISSNNPTQNIEVFKSADLDNKVYEDLAEEIPIAIIYNGISHVVMMASPVDLKDFALGFSITESIIKNKSDIYSIEENVQSNGIELNIEISSECFSRLKEVRRNLTGRTGCGLCGAESLNQVINIPKLKENKNILKFSSKSILNAIDSFSEKQGLQKKTGATHACGLFDDTGKLILIREDVGRHNALDKLIGGILSQSDKVISKNFFVLTSSRASYEMVQKLISIDLKLLVAISAPTALAVRLADQYKVTLIAFARNKRFNIYSHRDNISE
jgi:FdhD protein|tara:strand:+ start:2322 stop:3152 length:831 start_codon:yes stop_codon:yes gene_type:complete